MNDQASQRTAPPPEIYEHLARYLAGRSESGARVPVDLRREMYRTMTQGRPELRARLDRLIQEATR